MSIYPICIYSLQKIKYVIEYNWKSVYLNVFYLNYVSVLNILIVYT